MSFSISLFSEASIFSPKSVSIFSVEWINCSAWFLVSTISRRSLSASAFCSASLIIFSISESDNPPEAWILICCSLPVALSFADTLTIPLASISNVTSICGTPRGAGGIPSRLNSPRTLLSAAISRSPW